MLEPIVGSRSVLPIAQPRRIKQPIEVDSALPGREGTGRRSITLSPRRGTPISVRPRVREPLPAVTA